MGNFPRFKKSDIHRWLDTLKIPPHNIFLALLGYPAEGTP
jgi:hypothetical protein